VALTLGFFFFCLKVLGRCFFFLTPAFFGRLASFFLATFFLAFASLSFFLATFLLSFLPFGSSALPAFFCLLSGGLFFAVFFL